MRLTLTPRRETVDGRAQPGCRFAGLCPRMTAECDAAQPALSVAGPEHAVACLHPVGEAPTDT